MKAIIKVQIVINDEKTKVLNGISEVEDKENDLLMKILKKVDLLKNQVDTTVRQYLANGSASTDIQDDAEEQSQEDNPET